jgi:hypothetical protein
VTTRQACAQTSTPTKPITGLRRTGKKPVTRTICIRSVDPSSRTSEASDGERQRNKSLKGYKVPITKGIETKTMNNRRSRGEKRTRKSSKGNYGESRSRSPTIRSPSLSYRKASLLALQNHTPLLRRIQSDPALKTTCPNQNKLESRQGFQKSGQIGSKSNHSKPILRASYQGIEEDCRGDFQLDVGAPVFQHAVAR